MQQCTVRSALSSTVQVRGPPTGEIAKLYATAAVPSVEEHPLITLKQRAVTATGHPRSLRRSGSLRHPE